MKKIFAILSMVAFMAAIVPNVSAQTKKHVHKADSTKTTATVKTTPAPKSTESKKPAASTSTPAVKK
jgi:hypothetical protein